MPDAGKPRRSLIMVSMHQHAAFSISRTESMQYGTINSIVLCDCSCVCACVCACVCVCVYVLYLDRASDCMHLCPGAMELTCSLRSKVSRTINADLFKMYI